MRRFHLVFAVALGMVTLASALPHKTPLMAAKMPAGQMKSVSGGSGPYKVLKTAKVGGDGGFDYVNADSDGRRLYVARSGPTKRISVFDLDTLQPIGEI